MENPSRTPKILWQKNSEILRSGKIAPNKFQFYFSEILKNAFYTSSLNEKGFNFFILQQISLYICYIYLMILVWEINKGLTHIKSFFRQQKLHRFLSLLDEMRLFVLFSSTFWNEVNKTKSFTFILYIYMFAIEIEEIEYKVNII